MPLALYEAFEVRETLLPASFDGIPRPAREGLQASAMLLGKTAGPSALVAHPGTKPESVVGSIGLGHACVALALGELLQSGVSVLPSVFVRIPRPSWQGFQTPCSFDGELPPSS